MLNGADSLCIVYEYCIWLSGATDHAADSTLLKCPTAQQLFRSDSLAGRIAAPQTSFLQVAVNM